MNTTIPSQAKTLSRLDDVRIAITHSSEQAEEQARLFQSLGAQVFYYPSIEIIPFDDNGELDGALREAAAGQYDWLVLNDADTILVVSERIRATGIDPMRLPRRLKVATIGCMTEQWTHDLLGIRSDFAPEEYSPNFVAEALRLKSGDRVLIPQSAMTRMHLARRLRETGADVTAINAYRTVIGQGGDPIPTMLWEGKLDAVTFTFPTAVRYFARRIKAESGSLAMLDHVCVACIGPLTAGAAQELGLHVDLVPEKHTIQGLVEAIAAYFSER
jgi:uroporphyrinogen-III synthase